MWTVVSREVKKEKKVWFLLPKFIFVGFLRIFLCHVLWFYFFLLLQQTSKNDESGDGAKDETEEAGEEGEGGEEGEKGEKEKEKEGAEKEEKTESSLEDAEKKHGFLILSREDSTMVPDHFCC